MVQLSGESVRRCEFSAVEQSELSSKKNSSKMIGFSLSLGGAESQEAFSQVRCLLNEGKVCLDGTGLGTSQLFLGERISLSSSNTCWSSQASLNARNF